ncbi:CTP synthase (glutamine hydrolyzing) [archaeon]|jgi:CTP synthase|nr:CTP synthase (glutamine hydrolyzing) [archaeon]MBT3450757.1 CTP synthase (glutamine hydrolyzing) [archaeon]MBT6869520.1 CTP synthase (glutamine hydrolyzing) [archaeon]MBT7193685.1 CTP synthase (glutamine hydrolyzing) [archaeon]MBT7380376.1 CTP synthase (glutamine hydrolyzing) [archaeon]
MHQNNYHKKTKFIIITGGVISGLGKGIAAASIGKLLNSRLKIIPIKLDGYLNVDPGTMNPMEHGEVFVLNDGGEVDMDFGHYERFLEVDCKSDQNLTMGKVFEEIRKKERKGEFLGKTVQFIPHVTDLIKSKFFEVAKKEKADLVLIEVGGTVGDIENELYIEAVRQLKSEVGSDNILYVHLTHIPIPSGVQEQKSKPTQQSINMLRERGIQPDIIIGRCEQKLTDKIKNKISVFGGIEKNAVISGIDVDNVYKIPLAFEEEGICEIIHRKLRVYSPPDLTSWKELLNNINEPINEIIIAICGKYTELNDSYASINEALMHCSAHTKHKINLKFIETTDIENNKKTIAEVLENVSGVIIPGGFGSRGTEGKIEVIKYCRENNLPILGICLGLHLMVVEFARNLCNLENANSTEINSLTPYPVIDIMPEQKDIENKGATMRLGSYPAWLSEESLAKRLYQKELVHERHRHRFEVNPNYHQTLKENGLTISGTSKDGRLIEFIELKNHHYFIATQAHPELKSTLTEPAPLFLGLIKSAISKSTL